MEKCDIFKGKISFSRIFLQYKIFSYILKACKMIDFNIKDLTNPS